MGFDIFSYPEIIVDTILESTDKEKDKETSSNDERNSADESNSIGSISHSSSYDSLSEGSYELRPWHGKLSMSWESIGPDKISSNLFLSPQTTGTNKIMTENYF